MRMQQVSIFWRLYELAVFATIVFGLLLVLMIVLVQASTQGEVQEPIRLFLDGQPIGTLGTGGVVYDIANSEIRVYSAEGVFGCELDLIFEDDFEFGP